MLSSSRYGLVTSTAPADTTLPDFKTLLEDLQTSNSEGLSFSESYSPVSSYGGGMDLADDIMAEEAPIRLDGAFDLWGFSRRDIDDDYALSDSALMMSSFDSEARRKIERNCSKLKLPLDPRLWSSDDVLRWLKSTVRKFGSSDTCVIESDWLINGEELCRLPRYEFEHRLQQDGDTVFTELELWKSVYDMAAPSSTSLHHSSSVSNHSPSPMLPSAGSYNPGLFLHDSPYDDLGIGLSYTCLDPSEVTGSHYISDIPDILPDNPTFSTSSPCQTSSLIHNSVSAASSVELLVTCRMPYSSAPSGIEPQHVALNTSNSSICFRQYNGAHGITSSSHALQAPPGYTYIIGPQPTAHIPSAQAAWKPSPSLNTTVANHSAIRRYDIAPVSLTSPGMPDSTNLLPSTPMFNGSHSNYTNSGLKIKLECNQEAYSEEVLSEDENWMHHVSSTQFLTGEIDPKIDDISRRWAKTSMYNCDRPKISAEFPTSSSSISAAPTGSGRRGKRTICLWQFLKELLLMPQYQAWIRWLDQNRGIFKIEDSVRVARLWGERKNRPMMNYDKLSRSIRQYYRKGIIQKTSNSKRLVYQFCPQYI